MQKRGANHYFNFTRRERNGTLLLLFLIVLLTTIPFIYSLVFKEKLIEVNRVDHELATLQAKQQSASKDDKEGHHYKNYSQPAEKRSNEKSIKGELFYFDPNTLSPDEWKKLGVRDKTIHTIQNFIAKGGRFRQPDDIKKIWGLHKDEVERLMPYARITENVSSAEPVKPLPAAKYESKKTTAIIDVNLADSADLIKLPGIGPKLSNRIINFREKLGGFYSVDQVAETFGLPDSVFQKIKPQLSISGNAVKQVNINTATLEEMKQHPYIKYNLANLIVQYRTQHGSFADVSGIKKIMTVGDSIYNRLSAYLTVK